VHTAHSHSREWAVSVSYQEALFVSDGNLCQSAVITMNDTTFISGSARHYCDGETHVMDLFADNKCLLKSPSQSLANIQRNNLCLLEPTGGTYTKLDCTAPKFHCKDITTTQFALATTTEQPSGSPVGSPSAGPSEGPTASDAGSRVDLVSLTIISMMGYTFL
jgi:hypothetical protein